MPIFQYRGYRTDGSEVAGTLEANSQKDAVLRLQESGLYPKKLLVTIKEKVAAGASFSKALEECDHIFPEFYVNMVAAGETSGTLDKVLGRLADFLDTQPRLKSKVQTSMIYPVFMICVGFIVLSFLFTFVIPKIPKIFKDTEPALPLLTVVLIAISDIFQRYWWLLIGLLLSGIFGFG